VLHLLGKHQNLVILSFRFLYGLRTVTPFAIGMSKVSYVRFTVLNLVGAGIWAVGISLAGYYFGHAVDVVLGDIKHYELEILASIAVVAVLIWLVRFFRQSRSG